MNELNIPRNCNMGTEQIDETAEKIRTGIRSKIKHDKNVQSE